MPGTTRDVLGGEGGDTAEDEAKGFPSTHPPFLVFDNKLQEDVPLLDSPPPIPLGSQSMPLLATLGWTREGKLNVTSWAKLGGTDRELFAEVYFSLGCKGGAGDPTVELVVKQVEFGVTNCCTGNCSPRNPPCLSKCKTAFIYKLTIEVCPKSWAKRDCHRLELQPYHTPAVFGLERNSSSGVHIPVRVTQAALTYQMGDSVSQTAPSFGWSPAWTDGHTVAWTWELRRFADGTEVEVDKFRWGSRPVVPIPPHHFQLHPESFQADVKWEFADPVVDLLSRLERERLEFDVKITLDTAVSESKRRGLAGFKVSRGPTVTFDRVLVLSSRGIIFRPSPA